MKKKVGKKLVLSRETLRELSRRNLSGVAGGLTQDPLSQCTDTCTCVSVRICPTERLSCSCDTLCDTFCNC